MRVKLIILLLAVCVGLNAQTTQVGVIQEYNERAKKTPLAGVELSVRSANSTVSDKKGQFSLQFLTLKPGEKVNVRRIEKMGYEIFNKEAVEQWNINPKNPFVIVMCRSDRFKKIRDNYEKVSSESYARQLKKEEAALLKLKEEGKLKEVEYTNQLIQLRENYEKQLDKLENYVDRFSRIDLSELSSVEQEIIALVQKGKIEEAIEKYEEQNYVDKYTKEVAEIKEVSSAIDQLSEVKSSKEQSRDSLLAAIDRQIETLKLAGGKENYDKVGVILKEVAFTDTTNLQNITRWANYAKEQNLILEAVKAYNILAKEYNKESSPENIDKLATVYDLLGSLYSYYLNDNENAQIAFKNSLEIKKGILNLKGEDYRSEYNISMNNYGFWLANIGRFEESENYLMQVLESREKIFKNDSTKIHPYLNTLRSLGVMNCMKGDMLKGEKFFRNAFNLQEKLVLNDTTDVNINDLCGNICDLANCCSLQKKFDQADSLFNSAISFITTIYEKNPLKYAVNLRNLCDGHGYSYLMRNMTKEAIPLYEKSLEYSEMLSLNHQVVDRYSNLILLYKNDKRLQDAKNTLARAYKFCGDHVLLRATECVLLYSSNQKDKAVKIYNNYVKDINDSQIVKLLKEETDLLN